MKTLLALVGIAGFTMLAVMASCVASAQLATNVTITNLQGRVFRNITLDHANEMGVVWTTAGGNMGEIKFTDLPMDFWDKLSLSNSAQKYIAAIALRQDQERQRQIAREKAARQQMEVQRNLQEMLSATNSEEQKIDAMEDDSTNMSPDEKSARDGLLKALLGISSSTSVGVNRNDYGSLLAKTRAALEFARTKLPIEHHKKFLLCAEKAIGFYSKANDEWSDYFKYDWEREQDETYMSVADFYDLRENGVPVQASNFTEKGNGVYVVPFKTALSLYWQAADIYVHKMQAEEASLP